MHGFISAHGHHWLRIINENWVAADSEIVNEIASTANAWIRQSTQPSVDLEIINEIASMVDACVR
jgi:hypothetical protein